MNENRAEIRRICRLLRTTVQLAEQATLTGSLQQGVQNCIHQYNTILARLEETGATLPGLFRPLPDSANFDEVGVASAQLASYLDDDQNPTEAYSGPKYFIIKGPEMATGSPEKPREPRNPETIFDVSDDNGEAS